MSVDAQTATDLNECAKIEAELSYEPHAIANVAEHSWISTQKQTIDYVLKDTMVDIRIKQLSSSTSRYVLFISNHVREMTFYRDVNAQSTLTVDGLLNETFYTSECLTRSGLELGTHSWHTDKPSASKLAAAGFFTTLRGDEIYCYCCGLRLADLKAGDDCWMEHAYHSPDCGHVLAHRGSTFVREVQDRYNDQTSSASWIDSVYSGTFGFFHAVSRRVEPRDYRARPELLLFRAICEESGFNNLLFAYCIESEMRRTGKDFDNMVDLVEANRELEMRMRLTNLSDPHEFIRRRNAEADALARGMHPSQTSARTSVQHDGAACVDNVNPQTERQGATGNFTQQQHANDGVPSATGEQRRIVCAVCYDSPVEVVYVPCGHLSTCFDCSTRLTDCPVCRTPIRGTLRVRV